MMRTMIKSVFFLGLLVRKHDFKRERRVGALVFISISNDCFTWLKFPMALFDFCLVIEL